MTSKTPPAPIQPERRRLVAIAGRPNVGKSAIFNRLAGRRVAIVHSMAGVTRDRLALDVEWEGHPFTLVDTGGISRMQGEDVSGTMDHGICEQAEAALAEAAAVIFVVDIVEGLTPMDEEVARLLHRSGRPVFLAANKADDPEKEHGAGEFERLGFPVFPVSALHRRGFFELMDAVLAELPPEDADAAAPAQRPLRVAVVGRPNAGKSSLLNALLKESRAIVTSIPGTTRDIIEAVMTWRGIPLRLVDTAGITENFHDEVEAIGVQRARDAMREADVRVWVIDGSDDLHQEDVDRVLEMADTPHIVVLSKADLPQKISTASLTALIPASTVIPVSASKGLRLDELKESLTGMISGSGALDTGLNASTRQVEELRTALECVDTALSALRDGLGQDLISGCLSDARAALSRIGGGDCSEDLLHEIFGKFCIGK